MGKRYAVLFVLLLLISGCWWFRKAPEIQVTPTTLNQMGASELRDVLLTSEDPELRAVATLRLVERHDKRGASILSDALRTAPEHVVSSILKVLTQGTDDRLIPALIDVLEARNPAFQPMIFDTFKLYERESLTDTLFERVYDSEKPLKFKQNVIVAIGRVKSKKAVEPLMALLGSNEGDLDNQLNEALAQITLQRFSNKEDWQKWWDVYKNKPREIWLDEAVNNYQRQLNDKNCRIEALTKEIVGLKTESLKIKLEAAKTLPDGVLPILLAALTDNYWQVRKFAVEKIRTLPKDKLKEAIPKLTEMLNGPEEELRIVVITAIGEFGDESVLLLLVNLLANPKESEAIRKSAALALGKIGNPATTPPLVNILKEKSTPLLLAVIEALGKIKDKSCSAALLACLNDKDKPDEVQRAVIDALGEIKDAANVEPIIKFTDDKRDKFRWSAATALGKIGAESAIPALIKLLSDDRDDVRQTSVEALGNIGSETSAQALVKPLLNDKDPRTRELAAGALGKIKSKPTVASLISSLTDANERVGNAAWASILLISADDVNLMAETAQHLEEAKNFLRAAELYNKLNEKSDKPEYLKFLIRCYKELDKPEDVVKGYTALIAKLTKGAAEWWEAEKELVDYLYGKKDYAKTLDEIKKLLGDTSAPPALKEHLETIRTKCEEALKG